MIHHSECYIGLEVKVIVNPNYGKNFFGKLLINNGIKENQKHLVGKTAKIQHHCYSEQGLSIDGILYYISNDNLQTIMPKIIS